MATEDKVKQHLVRLQPAMHPDTCARISIQALLCAENKEDVRQARAEAALYTDEKLEREDFENMRVLSAADALMSEWMQCSSDDIIATGTDFSAYYVSSAPSNLVSAEGRT